MSKEFTGVWIPKAVYESAEFSPTDKLILSDIYNLCSSSDTYFKSNDTIGKEIGISVPTVTRSVKHLVKLGYIISCYDGRIRLIKMTRALIKMIRQTNQNDDSDSSKRLDSIQESIQLKEHISKTLLKKEIILPWKTETFIEKWDIWIDERKEKKIKKYTYRGEQAALHNLQKVSNGDEVTAIKIIQYSITHGYAGLWKLKTDYNKQRQPINREKALRWASGDGY